MKQQVFYRKNYNDKKKLRTKFFKVFSNILLLITLLKIFYVIRAYFTNEF